MQKLLKKELWKDITVMVILLGIAFFWYTTFKKILFIKYSVLVISVAAMAYGFFYTMYNCKSNKERKWLFAIYSVSLVFMYFKDSFDTFIYLIVGAIFLEDREKFLEKYFTFSTVFIAITIACYFFKLIPAQDAYRGDEFRYSLGFVHPNTVFRYFFGSLIPLYIMDKKKVIFNIYAISAAVPLYLLTDSRTGLICTILFVVAANLGVVFEKKIKNINFRFVYLFMTIFSFCMIFFFNENDWLNELLTGRPRSLNVIVVNAKWHLLYGNAKFMYCDNRFIYLLVKNGIVSLILTNIFYYFVFKKETSVELKIVFSISMVYCLTENLRDLGQTIVPLLCLWSFYDNYVKVNNCKLDNKKLQELPNSDNN